MINSYFFLGDIMKKILEFFKKVVFSAFIIYGYNLISVNFDMIIPINLITVVFVALLGFPGFFALILFKYFIL